MSKTTGKMQPLTENQEPEVRLPPPKLDEKVKNSVLVNPIREAENKKLALLARHVPLSENHYGKKVCRRHTHGKCALGAKCPRVHEEYPVPSTSSTNKPGTSQQEQLERQSTPAPGGVKRPFYDNQDNKQRRKRNKKPKQARVELNIPVHYEAKFCETKFTFKKP